MKPNFPSSLLISIFYSICALSASAQQIRYVKPLATGNGTSWNDSGDLQTMIDNSSTGDQIWVTSGTYHPNKIPTGCTNCMSESDKTFLLKDGVKIYGGFSGAEINLSERNFNANPTILSGDLGNGINARHVIISIRDSRATQINGFTIKDGKASSANSNEIITIDGDFVHVNQGGGMYNCVSSPTIVNCAFVNNTAYSGGGIAELYSSSKIVNSIFATNSAANHGGGIVIAFSQPEIMNCLFAVNSAPSGAGMLISRSASTIVNSILIEYDQAVLGSQTVITNCFKQSPGFKDVSDPDGPDDVWMTADDGLQLAIGSEAIDAGTNVSAPTVDILGQEIYNVTKDIGPYERQDLANYIFQNNYVPCTSIYLTNVKGFGWQKIVNRNGLVAEINPNGLNLGTLSIRIGDYIGVLKYGDQITFLGRGINVQSSNYPENTTMPGNYSLRLYYLNSELAEYNLNKAETNSPSTLNVLWKQRFLNCDPFYLKGASEIIDKTKISTGKFVGNDNAFFLQFDLNHFTWFLPTTATANPLPVTLLSFTGTNKGSSNQLAWQTTSETNSDYFEVERSDNAILFKKIGEKVLGSGNTNQLTSYSFIDMNYNPTTNYYRLKQIDLDGKFNYSRIIAIENSVNLTLYPNPANDRLYINTDLKILQYKITDLSGKRIEDGKVISKSGIPIKNLTPGIYFIQFNNKVLKFIKE